VFSMQAAGLIVGPLLAAALLVSNLSHDLVWRILLAAGAIPAMAVFQMRRQLAETPRFLLAQGQHTAFAHAANHALGQVQAPPLSHEERRLRRSDLWSGFGQLVTQRPQLVRLVAASLSWAFMDFAYYGNTVSSPLVLAALSPQQSALAHTLVQLAVFVVAALPGYLVAAAMMDRMGRKSIQLLGFAMMTVTFRAIALVPEIDKLLVPFLLVYGISYFFTEFGPNATTFVYPAELFPVECRTTGHGIASAAGKLGGFVGVFLFPIFMAHGGLFAAELAAAAVSLAGLAATLLLPETKGRSLEELGAA
jgi:PHS family inorganic phosphate transporter-like MFS transporter